MGGVVEQGCVADIAPSPLIASRLSKMASDAHVGYLGIDFDPGADARVVNLQASLTELPLPEKSVGLLVCFHVLEHIPDDRAAMRELARVLAPGGLALVQVPRRWGVPTDEDPDAPVEERLTRFGQADHVRYYGDDFEERLDEAGLSVERIAMSELYEPWLADLLGILHDEPIWLCSTGASISTAELAAACMRAGRETLVDGLDGVAREREEAVEAGDAVRSRLARARQRSRRAQESEASLRRRLDVRITTAVGRRARRVLRGRTR
jgi:hypothetical protein